jgi:hypothetical protein
MYTYTDYTYTAFNGPDPKGRGLIVTFRDGTGDPEIQEIFDKRFTLDIQDPPEKDQDSYRWEIINKLKEHYTGLLQTCSVSLGEHRFSIQDEDIVYLRNIVNSYEYFTSKKYLGHVLQEDLPEPVVFDLDGNKVELTFEKIKALLAHIELARAELYQSYKQQVELAQKAQTNKDLDLNITFFFLYLHESILEYVEEDEDVC